MRDPEMMSDGTSRSGLSQGVVTEIVRERADALAEVKRLRQGLWNCAVAAGIDPDGDTTPDHLAFPDIVDFALEAVRELREDYNSAALRREGRDA